MKALLQQFADNNFLITCDNWFVAPDGKQYRSVWGKVTVHSDSETLGIKTNIRSTNWYAKIGIGERTVIVAGCQIRYACVCMKQPYTGMVDEIRINDTKGETFAIKRDNIIYLAQ